MNQGEYVAGSCNIGPEEVKLRTLVGWIAGLLVPLLTTFLLLSNLHHSYRLLLAVPVFTAVLGFLQARLAFCVKYGLEGVSSMDPEQGRVSHRDQVESMKKDRAKAFRILAMASMSGVFYGIIVYLL